MGLGDFVNYHSVSSRLYFALCPCFIASGSPAPQKVCLRSRKPADRQRFPLFERIIGFPIGGGLGSVNGANDRRPPSRSCHILNLLGAGGFVDVSLKRAGCNYASFEFARLTCSPVRYLKGPPPTVVLSHTSKSQEAFPTTESTQLNIVWLESVHIY